jgi:hypothetical protein
MTLILSERKDNLRAYELPNGNLLRAIRTDPYGFWHLSLLKGNLPVEYSNQQFTTIEDTERAIIRYMATRNTASDGLKGKPGKEV